MRTSAGWRNLRLIYDLNFARLPWRHRCRAMCRAALHRMIPRWWSGPTVLLLGVTSRCQCDCTHCGVKGEESVPDPDRVFLEKVIEDFGRSSGVKVFFFGGEPLLRDDLEDLVACASRQGLVTCVSTNGLLLKQSRAEALARAGLCSVEISLDSVDPVSFARYRGVPGILASVEEAIAAAHTAHLPVSVSVVAHREMLKDGLALVIARARSLGVRSVRLLEPVAAGAWAGCIEQRLTEQERAQMDALMADGFVHGESQGSSRWDCPALRGDMLYVSASGLAKPCCFMDIPLGLAGDAPLAVLAARARRLREEAGVHDTPGCPVNDERFRDRFRLHRVPK